MIKTNIIIACSKWKKKISKPHIYLKKKITKLKSKKALSNKIQEFSILLTDNKEIKKLNFKFRGKNIETDILSFPFSYQKKKNGYLGDIAISYNIVNKRSKNSNFYIEFDKMWIHGYLHLLGYDHKKMRDFKVMAKKEKKLLKHLEYNIN